MTKSKRVGASIASFVLIAGLVGCGSQDKGKQSDGESSGETGSTAISGEKYTGPAVELNFWTPITGPDGEKLQELVDKFNADNANIKVVLTSNSGDDHNSKLPVALGSGNGPEVAVVHMDRVSTNAAQGLLTPVTTYAGDLGWSEAQFAEVPWRGGAYQGEQYCVPLDVHPHGMYYNKDVLRQVGLDADNPPATAEQYMNALAVLKENGIAGQWISDVGANRLFTSLLKQYGGELYNEDGSEVRWDSEAGVKALTWLQDLITNEYSPKNVGLDEYWTAFKANETAFVWDGIWMLGDKDLDMVDWGVAPLPVIGEQEGVWGGSHQLCVTNQVEGDQDKLAASLYFLNQLSANSLNWAKANQVPARLSVLETPEFTEIPGVPVFAEMLPSVLLPGGFPGISDSDAKLNEAISAALLSGADPKDSLEAAAVKANQILKENKDRYGY